MVFIAITKEEVEDCYFMLRKQRIYLPQWSCCEDISYLLYHSFYLCFSDFCLFCLKALQLYYLKQYYYQTHSIKIRTQIKNKNLC